MMGDKLPPFPYDLKNIPRCIVPIFVQYLMIVVLNCSTVSAYREPISRITFLPNIGRGGGSDVQQYFCQQFRPGERWCHLDCQQGWFTLLLEKQHGSSKNC